MKVLNSGTVEQAITYACAFIHVRQTLEFSQRREEDENEGVAFSWLSMLANA